MQPAHDASALLSALEFAAEKHRDQRRKGIEASPYINHPIRVARLLADAGDVREAEILQAAILHDTLEDTRCTAAELEQHFGARVRRLVEEVSDDKDLAKAVRKRLQIEDAARLSPEARLIKVADKIANVLDVAEAPPRDWSMERRVEYLNWATAVIAACGPTTPALDQAWRQALSRARAIVTAE